MSMARGLLTVSACAPPSHDQGKPHSPECYLPPDVSRENRYHGDFKITAKLASVPGKVVRRFKADVCHLPMPSNSYLLRICCLLSWCDVLASKPTTNRYFLPQTHAPSR